MSKSKIITAANQRALRMARERYSAFKSHFRYPDLPVDVVNAMMRAYANGTESTKPPIKLINFYKDVIAQEIISEEENDDE